MRSSAPDPGGNVRSVRIAAGRVVVRLVDGREISVPLEWYPRLRRATPAQRRGWRLIGGGLGIHWPAIDEDISVAGLLRGAAAPGGGRSRS